MKKKKLVNAVGVVLDEYLFQELVRVTDELEVSKSEFIRKLIEKEFERERVEQESSDEKASPMEDAAINLVPIRGRNNND
jgi:metal-responsive CopG/Arc/MetJ family transcriptional regulator